MKYEQSNYDRAMAALSADIKAWRARRPERNESPHRCAEHIVQSLRYGPLGHTTMDDVDALLSFYARELHGRGYWHFVEYHLGLDDDIARLAVLRMWIVDDIYSSITSEAQS